MQRKSERFEFVIGAACPTFRSGIQILTRIQIVLLRVLRVSAVNIPGRAFATAVQE
jgi:hypothetical protein